MKILALERARRLHREQIIDALWPHLLPDAAAANLRKAVHLARGSLGSKSAIATKAEVVELWPGEAVTVDAIRFEHAARAALQSHDPAALADAAALYEGELLPGDRYAPWAEEPRDRLRFLAVRVFKASSQWERVLEIDPADEEAHRALMERALDCGDSSGAIRQFMRLRERLRVDLAMGPGEQSVALYERALRGREPARSSAIEQASALLAWGGVHLASKNLDEAERWGEAARSLALDASSAIPFAEATALLGIVAHQRGNWKEMFQAEFADAVQRSSELAASIFDAHLCIAEFHLFGLSDPQEIVSYASELLDVAEGAGSVEGRAIAELLLGEADLIADRLDSADRHLTNSIDLHRRAGAVAGHGVALQRLAEVAVARADYGRARRLLRSGLRLAEPSTKAAHLVVRMHEGLIGAARGPAERKAVEVAEADLAGRVVCPPCSIGFRLAAAKAFARSGRLDLARRRFADAEHLARMWPGGPWYAALWEARGELRRAQGDEEAATVMLREAADRFAEAGRRRDEARCRAAVRSGRVLAPPGRQPRGARSRQRKRFQRA